MDKTLSGRRAWRSRNPPPHPKVAAFAPLRYVCSYFFDLIIPEACPRNLI
jgi:hypothetical protein